MFVPYPGSELFEKLKKENKLKMDDNYFKRLMAYHDITRPYAYCDHVSGRMISILRFIGYSFSYIAIYISRPKRIYRLLKNIFKKKFFANNLLEQRFYEFYLRLKLKREQKKITLSNY